MLKVSAFYLEKQKSFIPKKKYFLSRCQYQNKKALFTDPIFSESFDEMQLFHLFWKWNRIATMWTELTQLWSLKAFEIPSRKCLWKGRDQILGPATPSKSVTSVAMCRKIFTPPKYFKITLKVIALLMSHFDSSIFIRDLNSILSNQVSVYFLTKYQYTF